MSTLPSSVRNLLLPGHRYFTHLYYVVNLQSLACLEQKSFFLHLAKYDSLDTTIKNMNAP